MFKNRPVIYFLIKSILIFLILAAPFSFYDNVYGNFYRSTSKMLFGKFHDSGIAVFKETKEKSITHIDVGNLSKIKLNGAIDTATSDFSTRYRGYIPTIFLLSLIFASPVSFRRKINSAVVGFILMTILIMIKQWIHILYMCEQNKLIGMYDFTPKEAHRIGFLYNNIANYSGPTLIFAIAIWILVTFKKKDLEVLLK